MTSDTGYTDKALLPLPPALTLPYGQLLQKTSLMLTGCPFPSDGKSRCNLPPNTKAPQQPLSPGKLLGKQIPGSPSSAREIRIPGDSVQASVV